LRRAAAAVYRRRVTQPAADALRRDLLATLVRRSYLREPGRTFTLASGRQSEYYIECSLTTTFAPALPLIGALVHAAVPADATAIGGPTMGADPIAAAVAYHSAGTARPISWFSVRKTAKEHGARRWLEGSVDPGDRVVVVEDVITSGGSIIDAVRKCREEQLRVARAVVLVDREEQGGRAAVERALADVGADLVALFTRADLEAAWQAGRTRTSA
jgi:orotate phosphoribosyltransferase